jgi:hypothetical protein
MSNTLVFVVAATVFNIVVFVVVFAGLMAVYLFVLSPFLLSDTEFSGLAAPFLIIVFVLSVGLSFFIYRFAVNVFLRGVNVEERFAPLFARREGAADRENAR